MQLERVEFDLSPFLVLLLAKHLRAYDPDAPTPEIRDDIGKEPPTRFDIVLAVCCVLILLCCSVPLDILGRRTCVPSSGRKEHEKEAGISRY